MTGLFQSLYSAAGVWCYTLFFAGALLFSGAAPRSFAEIPPEILEHLHAIGANERCLSPSGGSRVSTLGVTQFRKCPAASDRFCTNSVPVGHRLANGVVAPMLI